MKEARRAAVPALLLAAVLLLCPHSLRGQSLTHGTLEGTVTDPIGGPIPRASVVATSVETGSTRSLSSDEEGRFRLALLPPGSYRVFVERLGYRPVVVEGVRLEPARRVAVAVTLSPAEPPVHEAMTVPFEGAGTSGRPSSPGRWPTPLELDAPRERIGLVEAVRLSAAPGPGLSMEGLPEWMTRLTVDGTAVPGARHPAVPLDPNRWAAHPASAFASAELVTQPLDVEWAGGAGAVLSGHTLRGGERLRASSFAQWSGRALWSSRHLESAAPEAQGVWGGAILGGPLLSDSARILVGIEGARLSVPHARWWQLDDTLDARLRSVAQDSFGLDLGRYTRPHTFRSDIVSAFGRLDWELASGHTLGLRASIGLQPAGAHWEGGQVAAAPIAAYEGRDVSAGASLTSAFGARVGHELRLGMSGSRRLYSAAAPGAAPLDSLPAIHIVAGGLGFGSDPRIPGRFEMSALQASQTVHVAAGSHRLKLGMAVQLASHDHTWAYARRGEYVFAGAEEMAALDGSFSQAIGPLPVARFDLPSYAGFIQDTWSPTAGLDILLGVRVGAVRIPEERIGSDSTWLARTGVGADHLPGSITSVSPRVGLSWDVGGRHAWVVHAGAGIYHEPMDPALLTELITHDGDLEVRRGLGLLGGWPLPDSSALDAGRPRLSMVAPGFRPPRTTRATFGLARRVGHETTVRLHGVYRLTDRLPRRHDLNLLPSAGATDQYGRPVYGTLAWRGGLLASELGSPRRFPDYDIVSALESEARSRHWGFTAGFEHRSERGLGVVASWGWSRTTDDWLIGNGDPASELDPFPGGDWAEGVSSFDVPHRLAAGAEIPVGGRARVSAFYRFRSGDPFTPGFRDGVDANGDGSARNDPAFVDDAVPGVAELMTRWDCLREQAGTFAARNSCRLPGVHNLDVRVSVRLLDGPRYGAELVLDGINLLEPDLAVPDRALYLVTGDPAFDEATGTVTVPLEANPHFGEPLARQSTGRLFRLGLRLSY